MSNNSQIFKYVGLDHETGAINRGELKAVNERGAIAHLE